MKTAANSKSKPAVSRAKGGAAAKRKRESLAEWLKRIEPERTPRPDRDFTAMLMAERALER
jgi:hypothetical protein